MASSVKVNKHENSISFIKRKNNKMRTKGGHFVKYILLSDTHTYTPTHMSARMITCYNEAKSGNHEALPMVT